jgi:hypothetical protein
MPEELREESSGYAVGVSYDKYTVLPSRRAINLETC